MWGNDPPVALRCISAWAEEPPSEHPRGRTAPVHLRVGGGTDTGGQVTRPDPGASPRGRRNPGRDRGHACDHGCISAWAEEPLRATHRHPSRWVHLRVGGGTVSASVLTVLTTGTSPRGRRNRWRREHASHVRGCISAWAEEPRAPMAGGARSTVHLRVGGGTSSVSFRGAGSGGASPRGRRKRVGCISAWAEEPSGTRRRRRSPTVHLRVGGGTPRGTPPAGRPPRGVHSVHLRVGGGTDPTPRT